MSGEVEQTGPVTPSLRKKYRTYSEPANKLNVAGFKNVAMGKGKANGRSGKRRVAKGAGHPIGFSGRTMGLR